MDTIVQQICENFIGEIAEFFCQKRTLSIEEIETELKGKTNTFILEMEKFYLEQLDKEVVNDKRGRKEKGIVVERRGDEREIYTSFGPLIFSRTYFYDKHNKEYIYLLDKAVGLEPYERISGTVETELVEHAGETSYGESSRHITGSQISRQTVMKKLRKLKNLKIPEPSNKRNTEVLYINADEDHVSMQDGRKSIVPLISIHEGIERQGKRGICKNPYYISSYGKEIEELWLEAAKWIHQSYEVDSIERIYIHGDGASWIKEGLNWLPKAKLVLDRYHLNRAVTTAAAKQPEKRKQIYSAVFQDNKGSFEKVIGELKRDAEDSIELEKISNFARYINNNWSAVTIQKKENCGGSCTEGHVSHILSSRLSSRPMGWGRIGLRVMAELRAYKGSGGKIELKHLKDSKPRYKIKRQLVEKVNNTFKKAAGEKINNVTILKQGKVVPAFNCLKGLQNPNPTF